MSFISTSRSLIVYSMAAMISSSMLVHCGDKPTLARINSTSCPPAKKTTTSTKDKKNESDPKTKTEPTDKETDTKKKNTSSLFGLNELFDLFDESGDEENQVKASFNLKEDPEQFFKDKLKSTVDKSCVDGCHDTQVPVLDTYAKVKSASADVLRTIKSDKAGEKMPPGNKKLDAETVKSIETWFSLLPENAKAPANPTSTGKDTGTSTSKKSSDGSTDASKDESCSNQAETTDPSKDAAKSSKKDPKKETK